MHEITLTIPGPPVPWAAKHAMQAGGRRFIPARQEEAIGRVLRVVTEYLERGGSHFLAGEPLELSATFYVKRPKGHYGSGKNSRIIKPAFVDARPTGKPDLSNLTKLLEDGLVLGGLLPDDDQIVGFFGGPEKLYTTELEELPRTIARIRRADQ